MPIPCKDIDGFLINELQRPQHFECNCIECGNVQGFNEAITPSNKRERDDYDEG